MTGKAVELCVAGHSCRVVSTADEQQLQLLASMVEDKLADVLRQGRPVDVKAMLLAAIALAHDVHEQRTRADTIAAKAKGSLTGLLDRVDTALLQSESQQKDRKRQGKKTARTKQRDGDDDTP